MGTFGLNAGLLPVTCIFLHYSTGTFIKYTSWVFLKTRIETVCLFSDEWSAPDCNIAAPPPARWRHRGRKQRNQTDPESVSQTESSSHSPAESSGDERGSEQTEVRRVRLDLKLNTETRRLQNFKVGQEDWRTRRDSVWLGFVRFSSGYLKKKEKFHFYFLTKSFCLFLS